MQFSISRRQFLRNFFTKTNGNSKSTPGLDGIINGATLQMQDEQTLGRRDALKVLGVGLAGGIVASTFSLNAVEARSHPPSLIGKPTSLDRQVQMFTKDDISMLYEKDLQPNSPFRKNKRLVAVRRNSPHYDLDSVESGNGITRPYVSLFLQITSKDFYDTFKDRQKVTSLTRSVEYQNYLRTGRMRGRPPRKPNPNATKPEKSAHVRGAGIDISYVPMDSRQKQWMRNTLADLERAGYIEATEEIAQNTFHVMVFKNYSRYVQRRLGMNDRDFSRYYERVTGGRIY